MGRSVGEEFNSVSLDAFGLIAKEGRKYGLTTVLATQRPRDIPQDVLSQLGTMFVHRLTNERDRETIERACGDLDRSAAAFIPSLSQGETTVLGPDLPAPTDSNNCARKSCTAHLSRPRLPARLAATLNRFAAMESPRLAFLGTPSPCRATRSEPAIYVCGSERRLSALPKRLNR